MIKKQVQQFYRYAGCVQGKDAYTGPKRAEIYLTNRCNLDCIACWNFSPLLKGKNSLPPIDLEWDRAYELIKGLAENGCEEILFVGGGEPMIYPKIMESLELVKSLGMSCFITTNMIPITENRAIRMAEMGIDRIYISLWSATEEIYLKTHPNAKGDSFKNINERLRQFKELKLKHNTDNPKIIIHNVIFNMNCHEFSRMIEFAVEVGVTAVQFTMVYTIADATDVLLLDDSQRKYLIKEIDSIPEEIKQREGLHGPGSFLYELEIFRGRLEEPSAKVGSYDKTLMDKLPCQLGWFYTIIRPNGDVIPCCKGMNKPMGNLYENSFRDIWYSDKYNEFREKGKTLSKSDPYFAPIGCYKMCDNVGLLTKIESQMEKLRPFESMTNKLAVPLIKILKK